MDYVIDSLKKIWHLLAYIISIISGIMSILCFFGIDYSKLKLITISKINIFKKYVYKVKENITYRYIKIEIIMIKQYLNIKKILNQIINYFIKSQFSLASCCLLLIVIFIYNPFSYLNTILDIKSVVYNGDFNQNIINSDMNYFASSNSANELKSLINNNVGSTETKDKMGFKLELEHPDNHPEINQNEFDELYNSIFYADENYLEEVIKYEIEMLKNGHMENIKLDGESACSASDYSEIERSIFFGDNKSISSDLLEQIIKGRKNLFERYPNATLAWLLANSYQTYAYNYLRQTNSSNNILYFYMQSIYYSKISLKFDMDVEDKETRIRYIQMRYRDIANCQVIDGKVRSRAQEIYCTMDSLLDTSGSETNLIDINNQSVCVLYSMNTPQTAVDGVNVLIEAETSFPADHVTISGISDGFELEPTDMHGGVCKWQFVATFYIKGTYTVTVTAYNSDGESVSDEFTYIY